MQATTFIRANISKLYAFWFFHNLVFAYVIERLFWAGRGITIPQVVYLEILYSVVVFLLEVPTGALADRFGRKPMMILGAVFSFGEMLILTYAWSFGAFACAIIVAAVGKALLSGTSNALFYDSLAAIDRCDSFEQVLGRNSLGKRLAGAIAALVGGLIAERHPLVSTYQLSMVSLACSFLTALSLVEPQRHVTTEKPHTVFYVKTALSFLRGRKDVLLILLHGIVMAAVTIYVDEFWQVYLKETGVAVAYFGVFSIAGSFVSGAGAFLAHKFKHCAVDRTLVVLLLIWAGAAFAAAGLHSLLGIAFLLLAYLVSGIAEPLVSGYLHRRAASEFRTTVESFQSLALRAVAALVGLGFGWVAAVFSVFGGYLFLGVLVVGYVVFWPWRRRKGALFPGRRRSMMSMPEHSDVSHAGRIGTAG